MRALYDSIGVDYADIRKPDPRLARLIHAALGSAQTVLNIGAGTGSYEPDDRTVIAVEPSVEMISQRKRGAAPVVRARAEELPFADDMVDAAMAILTVHHWTDRQQGLAQMRRVATGPLVLLTYDPTFRNYWLLDYIPELAALDDAQMPRLDEYEAWLGPVDIRPVPIPHDCADGFLNAYWRRPAAYLNPHIRAGISSFWALGDIATALARLRDDLASGHWATRYAPLLGLDALDCGYRLVVAPSPRAQ